MFLPQRYVPANSINLINTSYIDTGVTPDSDISIEALFFARLSAGWIFGARNTNSNSSAGQTNYYFNINGANYIGYYNTRLSYTTNGSETSGFIRFAKLLTELEVTQGAAINSSTGSSSTFTGTQTMYVGSLNNGGTSLKSGDVVFYGFIVKTNGTTVCDLIPCFDTVDEVQGAYDLVSNTFHPVVGTPQTAFEFTVEHSEGGNAFAKLYHGETLTSLYVNSPPVVSNKEFAVKCIAIPDDGYVFKNWTDPNGDVVSTDREFTYDPDETKIKANFLKIVSNDLGGGYKTMAMRYSRPSVNLSHRDAFFASVKSAKVTEDALQRSTTVITLNEVPSAYREDIPIFLFNPRNEIIYSGIIKSVKGNEITCREPLSIFDDDFLFHPNNNLENGINLRKYNLTYALYKYMGWGEKNTDNALGDQARVMKASLFTNIILKLPRVGRLKQINILDPAAPSVTDTSIGNLEDFLLENFVNYNIYPKAQLVDYKGSLNNYYRYVMQLSSETIDDKEKITISDNVESINNVSVTLEGDEATVLVVFNSSGSTLRGAYGVMNDGSVIELSYPNTETVEDLVSRDKYVSKLVMSDENINSLIYQNLSNGNYNHKITFDLMASGRLYDINTIEVGQPIDFYYGDKLYVSVVTAKSYEINENQSEINSCQITLGKVRTSLTSKMNLNKIGKK